MNINLKYLTSAIAEHIAPNQVQCLSDTTIKLSGIRINISGDLVSSDRVTFRFTCVKSLLHELHYCGLLNCPTDALTHIQNRYRKFTDK
jgi:hypothetical protein